MGRQADASSLEERIRGYATLQSALADAPAESPFVTMWQPDEDDAEVTLAFGGFLDRARSFAAFYAGRGLRAGDTVVLIMPQGIALMAAFVGALHIGAIPTILAYPTFKIDPEKYRSGLIGVTRNIGARLVVLDSAFPPELLGLIAVSGDTEIATIDESRLPGAGQAPPAHAPDPDAVAFIQHSAGTTGLQKGVALPHGAVLRQLGHLARALELTGEDRIVSWLPLYHDMGLIACFVLPLVAHLHVVMESPTDWVLRPGSMLKLASAHRCTLCWLPNFAFQFMARRVPAEERQGLDLSSMRGWLNCSEPVRAQSMDEFREAYSAHGVVSASLQATYAMAENTFAVTQTVMDGVSRPRVLWVDKELFHTQGLIDSVPEGNERSVSFVSSGPCLDGNEAKIVDERGGSLPEGRVGEVVIRSDSLFRGYYNRDDLTGKALRAGWYHTGDSGFLWAKELFVIGRKDDTIIVGGKNLYPQDIEEIAFRHAAVHDGRAVAFGVLNPELGTQDLFVIAEVGGDGDLEDRERIEAEIRRTILGELGVAPRVVRLVPSKWMVKSSAGKPARSTNRAKFLRENPGHDPGSGPGEDSHG